MLDIPQDETVVKGFRLPVKTAAILKDVAETLDTTQVKVIIALINQFGPAIIEQEKDNAAL